MRDFAEIDNPFASFGREQTVAGPDVRETEDDEIEGDDEELASDDSPAVPASTSVYDVELPGKWLKFPFNKNCVLRTRGDTFYFDCGKKSFECSRQEIHDISRRKIGGWGFRYTSPTLWFRLTTILPMQVQLVRTGGNIMLPVAKLLAWSKTLSNDEMEPAVRKEITGIAWRWIFFLAWMPLAISLFFSLSEFAVHGWLAALGPLHGSALVFIGFVVATVWPNTRWAAALPTGCLACGVDYFVRAFFAPNGDEWFSYIFFGSIMFLFAGITSLPFQLDADTQQAFTNELNANRKNQTKREDPEEEPVEADLVLA